ncbi:MAG: MerR family transcriptional regulator [Bacteriovoracaceae bacterium]|jgi:DNA-binding transcriptional MerR regulator|nr:MerR family transcriptional regulator [Bacteriovoracaceae bacterium]
MSGTIIIPNKTLFKINEVCSITGVKPYVLRFWETEFDEINPCISDSGAKLFSHSDIEVIVFIKKLLFEDKKTIQSTKSELMLTYQVELNSDELPALPLNNDEVNTVEDKTILSEDISDDLPAISQQLQFYDIEKLVMAKQKLNSLLNSIDHLKERHQWS